jgi:gliding motility-associated lipoprotein GldH
LQPENKPNMLTSFRSFLLLLFSLSLTSCGPDIIFEKTDELPEAGWDYGQQLSYQFEVTDTSQLYRLELLVKHAVDFPRQNMYVKLFTTFPDGRELDELVSLELANKAGVWFGDCGEEWCDLIIPIQMEAYFDQPGPYQLRVEQYSRMNPLAGIRQVAFRVIDTGKSVVATEK